MRCKVINLSWFITDLSGAQGRVGIINENAEGSLESPLEFRVINGFDSLGSAGTEYGRRSAGL